MRRTRDLGFLQPPREHLSPSLQIITIRTDTEAAEQRGGMINLEPRQPPLLEVFQTLLAR